MKCLIGLLFATLVASTAMARDCPPVPQPPTPEAIAQAQQQAVDRGALWSLDKDGRRSYLFGSIHLGQFAWTVPGPKLREAWQATRRLAVEIDISDPGFAPALMQAQARAASLVLSPAEQARLDAQADAACLPRQALAALHPVLQATTYVSLSGRRDGLDPSFGQEQVLLAMARAAGRPVLALETVERQLDVLLPADTIAARRLLRQSLDSLERGEARGSLMRLSRAWERGELARIATPALLCQCRPSAQELVFLTQLNDERNPYLARRIADEHAQGEPLLAVVGLLHMTGPQALPRLLEGLGFKVQRVRF
ncbi:MAG: TraB/GumN family protein [Inhella sp.]